MSRILVGALVAALLFVASPPLFGADQRPQYVPSVEYKVMLQPSQLGKLRRLLNLDQASHKRQQVAFFDRADNRLLDRGVVLRLRTSVTDEGKQKAKTTVKLRPMRLSEVDPKWFGVDGFKFEYDRVGGQDIGTASLAVSQDVQTAGKVLVGKASCKEIFTKEQRSLICELTPGMRWKPLQTRGPIATEVWEVERPNLASEPLGLEIWRMGKQTFLELSVRDSMKGIAATQKRVEGWLNANHIKRAAAQSSKTAAAFGHFAAQ